MDNCIFCNIISGDIPTSFVFNDHDVAAFHDVKPQAPLHLLIVPKKHIATLNDLSENDLALSGKLLRVAQELSQKFNVNQSGYRLVINCNADGGQEIYHLHCHLLGQRLMHWPPG